MKKSDAEKQVSKFKNSVLKEDKQHGMRIADLIAKEKQERDMQEDYRRGLAERVHEYPENINSSPKKGGKKNPFNPNGYKYRYIKIVNTPMS